MTKIKICGLRRKEDVAYVNEVRPDYAGFVFAKSRRMVTKEQAKELRKMLHPKIVPVGVFVNEEVSIVAELVREGIIDVVQLHGDETEAYIQQLREKINPVTIIKAIRVAEVSDLKNCELLSVDYLLFDTFSIKEYGGTGHTFDWELIKEVKTPYFLAGGLNSQNVKDALDMLHPFAVDVSSAVEKDGWKDKEKINAFVQAVRAVCVREEEA